MGAAAYNRGSAVISRQGAADAAAAAKRQDLAGDGSPQRWEDARDGYMARIAQMERDMERAKRTIRSLEITRTMARQDAERAKSDAREWRLLAMRNMRRWQWVSRLLRMVASPEQVQAARQELADG